MDDDSRRVKLHAALKHTSHTVELRSDGTLVAEIYDFSDEAEQFLGGETAYGIMVAKETLPKLITHLRKEPKFRDEPSTGSVEEQLLRFLPLFPDRFGNYDGFKSWLERKRIPFTKYTDPFP